MPSDYSALCSHPFITYIKQYAWRTADALIMPIAFEEALHHARQEDAIDSASSIARPEYKAQGIKPQSFDLDSSVGLCEKVEHLWQDFVQQHLCFDGSAGLVVLHPSKLESASGDNEVQALTQSSVIMLLDSRYEESARINVQKKPWVRVVNASAESRHDALKTTQAVYGFTWQWSYTSWQHITTTSPQQQWHFLCIQSVEAPRYMTTNNAPRLIHLDKKLTDDGSTCEESLHELMRVYKTSTLLITNPQDVAWILGIRDLEDSNLLWRGYILIQDSHKTTTTTSQQENSLNHYLNIWWTAPNAQLLETACNASIVNLQERFSIATKIQPLSIGALLSHIHGLLKDNALCFQASHMPMHLYQRIQNIAAIYTPTFNTIPCLNQSSDIAPQRSHGVCERIRPMSFTCHKRLRKNPKMWQAMHNAALYEGAAFATLIYALQQQSSQKTWPYLSETDIKNSCGLALPLMTNEWDVCTTLEILRQNGAKNAWQNVKSSKTNQPYIKPSFASIVACGVHSAFPHYHPTKDSHGSLQNGVLLMDVGGQYYEPHPLNPTAGTTDTTRVIWLGASPISEDWQMYYTHVLKAHIAAATAPITPRTTEEDIDQRAREYLHHHNMHYGHSTGHGVSLLGPVHDDAPRLAPNKTNTISVGMVTSIEPAYYQPGFGGVRLENMYIACPMLDPSMTLQERIEIHKNNITTWRLHDNQEPQNLTWAPLTWVPFDVRFINPKLIIRHEAHWLWQYHLCTEIYLGPFLADEVRAWCQQLTHAYQALFMGHHFLESPQ